MGAGQEVKRKSWRQLTSSSSGKWEGTDASLVSPSPQSQGPAVEQICPQSLGNGLPALVGSESGLSTSGHPRWLCSPHTAQLMVLFMPRSMPMPSPSCAPWKACARFSTDPQKAEREDRQEEEEKGRGRDRRQIR